MDIISGVDAGEKVSVSTPNFLVPEPEILSRQDQQSGKWTIYSGSPFAVVDEKVLSIPVGSDEVARHIQTHEMVHAKLSPSEKQMNDLWLKRGYASTQSLIACEELRVHSYMMSIGFDPEMYIQDGSGAFVGKRIGEHGTFRDAVIQAVKYARTAEFYPYFFTLSQARPEWCQNIRPIVTEATRFFDQILNTEIAKEYTNTHKTRASKHGFGFTETLAQWIDEVVEASEEKPSELQKGQHDDASSKKTVTRINDASDGLLSSIEWHGNTAPDKGIEDAWEKLKVSTPMLTRGVMGAISKKRKATHTGKNPRRISRLYSDPERRIFDRVSRGEGGVVLIDTSGSMSLYDHQVREIVVNAPNAIVAQYSGGDRTKPNLYVIAKKGKMVDRLPEPNMGNGMDGPALEWAISQRKNLKEPIIWVSDGSVTGKRDEHNEALTMSCISICKKNGIFVVPDVDTAIEMLRDLQKGKKVTSTVPYQLQETYWNRTGHDLYLK
jgi:hypothetical protein